MKRRPADPSDDRRLDVLVAEVADLRDRLAGHDAQIAQLETSRSSARDGASDRRLRETLADTTEATAFRANELLTRSRLVPALAAALDGAMISDAVVLGCWLRQRTGERDGVVIRRLRGRRWLVRRTVAD